MNRQTIRESLQLLFRLIVLVASGAFTLHVIDPRPELPPSVNCVSAISLVRQGRSDALSLVWYDQRGWTMWAQKVDGQREAVLDIAPADAAVTEKLAGVRTAAHMPASFAADEAWSSKPNYPWPEEFGLMALGTLAMFWSMFGMVLVSLRSTR